MGDIGFVEPLDFEVTVEVGGRLAQALVGVVLERVLHIHREQVPDRGRRQLQRKIKN